VRIHSECGDAGSRPTPQPDRINSRTGHQFHRFVDRADVGKRGGYGTCRAGREYGRRERHRIERRANGIRHAFVQRCG
jgi:hypothetical protein